MLKEILLISVFGIIVVFSGCQQAEVEPTDERADEKPVNVLQEDFKGPSEPPSSVGPSEEPPEE